MPLHNILDHRTNENNAKCDAVFEIFDHKSNRHHTYWMESNYLGVFVAAAEKFSDIVTVYLYDAHKVRDDFNIMPAIHPLIREDPITIQDFR